MISSPSSCWDYTVVDGEHSVFLSAGTISTLLDGLEKSNFDGKESLVAELDRMITAIGRWTETGQEPVISIPFPSDNPNCIYTHVSGLSQEILPKGLCQTIKANLGHRISLLTDNVITAGIGIEGVRVSVFQQAFLLTNHASIHDPKILEELAASVSSGNTFLPDTDQEQLANLVSQVRLRQDSFSIEAIKGPPPNSSYQETISGNVVAIHQAAEGDYVAFYEDNFLSGISPEAAEMAWQDFNDQYSVYTGISQAGFAKIVNENTSRFSNLLQLTEDGALIPLDVNKSWFSKSWIQTQLWNGLLPYEIDQKILGFE